MPWPSPIFPFPFSCPELSLLLRQTPPTANSPLLLMLRQGVQPPAPSPASTPPRPETHPQGETLAGSFHWAVPAPPCDPWPDVGADQMFFQPAPHVPLR